MDTKNTIQSTPHLAYRPDIDGLRAIAVIAVIGFHAFPNFISGGFVGVDVFFVISGFLISSIILNNLELNIFKFTLFYSKRIRRIFPTLLIVMLCCFGFGWFTLLPDELAQLGKHIAGGSAFISNFILNNEVGYFDTSAETKPLLHLWSLAIEEQFYIFWPIMLWAIHKIPFRKSIFATFITTASFVFCIFQYNLNPSSAFYMLFSRSWELVLGACIAIFLRSTASKKLSFLTKTYFINCLSILGFLLIFVPSFLLTNKSNFPFPWALAPTLGTCLLIWTGQTKNYVQHFLLNNRLVIWIGLISYPLYLWHWPILSFSHIMNDGTPSLKIRLIAIVLSIFLSWITYYLIEKPFRLGFNSEVKTIILTGFMFLIGIMGFYTYQNKGYETRDAVKNFTLISRAKSDFIWPGNMKNFTHQEFKNLYSTEVLKNETTLFIGDSMIQQYYSRIQELLFSEPSTTNNAIFATGSGCPSLPSVQLQDREHCHAMMTTAFNLAIERPDITRIVIGSHWVGYTENGASYYVNSEGRYPITDGSAGYKMSLADLKDYVDRLIKRGKKVFLLHANPTGRELAPNFSFERNLNDFPNVIQLKATSVLLKHIASPSHFREDLNELASNTGATILDPVPLLCPEGICINIVNGVPIYSDTVHLTGSFVRNFKFIDPTIKR